MPIHAAKDADEHQDERPDAAKTCDLVGYLVFEGQAIVQRRLQLARQNRASLQTVETVLSKVDSSPGASSSMR